MNLFLSQKIKVLSLALIILVLYIHSNFHDYSHEILGMRFNHILQNVISVGLGRCAVPLFYMISGNLFFLNTENRISVVFNKMKKRIRTLLIPYIIACLFFPLFYWVMELIPIAGKYINGDGISILFRESFSEILLTLFYRGNNTSVPLAFHLWFLRDLIILVMISPVLFYVRRMIRKEVIVVGLFLLTYCGCNEYLPIVSAFWFMLGDASLMRLDKCKFWIVMPLFVLLSFFELYLKCVWLENLSLLVVILGVISIWNLCDLCISKSFILTNHRYLMSICSFTFFIYLYHEPTLNIVRKLIVVVVGDSSFGFALAYLLSPWIFVSLAVLIGTVLKRRMPKVYPVLVGGR